MIFLMRVDEITFQKCLLPFNIQSLHLIASFLSFGSRAQFWSLAASMKLFVSFRLLDLGSRQDSLDGWSARRKASATCPGWLWRLRSWWNERFWQEIPKYSKKTCPDANLSTTNPTCQSRAQTRAAAVGSQRLTASAMAQPRRTVTSNTSFVSGEHVCMGEIDTDVNRENSREETVCQHYANM
jgi:hypothetical protein